MRNILTLTLKKKVIIVLISVVVLTGIIVGGVFGGIAIKKSVDEKNWQAKQGHDTSL